MTRPPHRMIQISRWGVRITILRPDLGYGAELVAAYGPFTVQAEYLGTHYDRDPGLLVLSRATVARIGNAKGLREARSRQGH